MIMTSLEIFKTLLMPFIDSVFHTCKKAGYTTVLLRKHVTPAV